MKNLKNFFKNEKIEFFAVLPADTAQIINPVREHEIAGFESVVVFLIPYKTNVASERNVARFAAASDYHMYAAQLFERFRMLYPDCCCYCDNSPINEKKLAAEAGLGIIGENSLIINEKYGSYIFLGEIFLKQRFESYSPVCKPKKCSSCGSCKVTCPVGLDFSCCISLINQKKRITAEEEDVIRASRFKWGCDLCQDVCPYNIKAANTPIDFFKTDILDTLTVSDIDRMVSDSSFKNRAYAWRGEKVIKRNLEL